MAVSMQILSITLVVSATMSFSVLEPTSSITPRISASCAPASPRRAAALEALRITRGQNRAGVQAVIQPCGPEISAAHGVAVKNRVFSLVELHAQLAPAAAARSRNSTFRSTTPRAKKSADRTPLNRAGGSNTFGQVQEGFVGGQNIAVAVGEHNGIRAAIEQLAQVRHQLAIGNRPQFAGRSAAQRTSLVRPPRGNSLDDSKSWRCEIFSSTSIGLGASIASGDGQRRHQ